VLNGPQGTLFGRNATAGLVHIITQDPSDHTEFKSQIGYGNYQTLAGQAYFSTPLSNDVGWNIAFTGQNQGKGFGFDPTLDKDVKTNSYWGLRSKFVLRPGSGIKITLAGDYFHANDSTAEYLFPIVNQLPPRASQDSPVGFPGYSRPRSGGVSGKIEADLGFANLTSITAYRKLSLNSSFDVDAQAIDLFHLTFHTTTESVQQELRLASHNTEPFSWQVGAFFLHTITTIDQLQGGLALKGATLHILTHGVTDSISGFGEATYAITPTTHLTGGLRYTSDQRDVTGSHVDTLFGNVLLASAVPPDPKATFGQLTYRAALRQDVTDKISAYISLNRGFKSGEFNLQSPADPAVKPETIMAYEAGIKADLFDRRLRINIAGYHYDISNYQIRTTIGTHSELANAASVKVNGVDINTEAALSKAFHVTAGVTWLHSYYSHFGDPNATPAIIAPTPGGIATGSETALAPHFTLDVGATYTVDVGEEGKIRLTANATHKSSYVFEVNPILRQRAYTAGNASIEYDINKKLGIEFWMKNIGNKLYNVEELTTVGQGAVSAAPRTYGADVKVSF
jgi:iron complex outermembrane receptor protein